MIYQRSFHMQTPGRGTYLITPQVEDIISESQIAQGICNVFIHHTSASLILSENADPQVRDDLETFMQQTVPDGDPMFKHTAEGIDDMPAHVRTVLTDSGLTLPITTGRCALGTWQGIYLWEHRHARQQRKLTVTLYGET